ncbi:MAG TPA: translocation/assembly module TamB domain-containing protein [Bacteriovoracaceae bacterium]|nr:translocation/assembly module TamB domain-containing protein [Bacteriovoracaceae bacterium]
MKKYILYPLLGLLSLLLTSVIIFLAVLFFKPLKIINPKNLDTILAKTKVLNKWSWDEGVFSHRKIKWNERQFQGHFKNFCFEYENDSALLNTCMEEISWDFVFTYQWGDGLKSISLRPIKIRSSKTLVALKENPNKAPSKEGPPDVWGYWQMLWNDKVPDVDVAFKKIIFDKKDLHKSFDFTLTKTDKLLKAHTWELFLTATPDQMVFTIPKKYPFPDKVGFGRPLYFRGMRLTAKMSKSGIPLLLTGGLEALTINVNSFIDLPLKDDPASIAFRKKVILQTTAALTLPDVRGNLKKFGPKPMDVLPAPFNVMNGIVRMNIDTTEIPGDPNKVLVKSMTNIDLQSAKQFFEMGIKTDVGVDLENFSPGGIIIGLDFRRVALQLPRLSGKELPPQFLSDSRIKTEAPKTKTEIQAEEAKPVIVKLQAQGAQALQIESNLLDEPLRLNLDLFLQNAVIKNGHVDILPFRTTVFKRPIVIPNMRVTFNPPMEPVIQGTIVFKLPEYKITLSLKGPISKPRHAFTSSPPLPQNDIYAVLLFGRPMADLNPDDKSASQKTSQLLSQGILSLSVLYFLAGSPVEYVGLDPETGGATAQIGLGSKSSLRVGGGDTGVNSTAVRRSLGKGWYLDTSVQNSNSANTTQERTYGVLLERIIAY